MCLCLEKLWGKTPINSFLAGFTIGALIFGQKTAINYQIVLYLLSRVVVASAALLYKKFFPVRANSKGVSFERKHWYLLLAAGCWGLVMFLFRVDHSVLQESLASSMKYLYLDSNMPV